MKQPTVAIITGAGSGIGRALAGQLAQIGYDLMLVGRDAAKLESTMTQVCLDHPHIRARAFSSDVGTAADGPERIVRQTLREWGRVDVLVNNAAIGELKPLSESDRALLQRTFEVNTFGPAMLIGLLWPTFMSQRSGCIVNVSSMSVVDPFPGLGIYGASKAALESLARSIRNEGDAYGIRAYNIAPGAVETPMLRSMFPTTALPENRTLSPARVAQEIVACIQGKSVASGKTVNLPSP